MIDMDKISQALTNINAKLNTLSDEKYKTLKDSLDKPLEPSEIMTYQQLKSIAQMEQKISLEVALWIYGAIGSWGRTKLGEKILLTQLFASWAGVIHR
jgi:hypothetical protein